jgi:hypothetical protein
MDIDKEAAIASWLTECRQILSVIEKIGQTIIFLNSKRSTLEEKMIKSYLSEVAANLSAIVSELYQTIGKGDSVFPEALLLSLRELVSEAADGLDELIKICNYNPNHLEQYFEHDYLARIKEKQQLLDRVQVIRQAMQ